MTFKSRIYELCTANRYDAELGVATDAVRQSCVQQFGINPGSTVLDLGCGTGLSHPYLVRALGNEGRILGVDASSKMLEQARERAQREGFDDRVQLIQGDVGIFSDLITPHLKGGKADAVLMTFFLSVVQHWKNVFAQAFGILAPGGRCAILDHYWQKPTWKQRIIGWRYTANSTRRGFEPLQQVTSDFHMGNFPAPGGGVYYIATGTKNGLVPE